MTEPNLDFMYQDRTEENDRFFQEKKLDFKESYYWKFEHVQYKPQIHEIESCQVCFCNKIAASEMSKQINLLKNEKESINKWCTDTICSCSGSLVDAKAGDPAQSGLRAETKTRTLKYMLPDYCQISKQNKWPVGTKQLWYLSSTGQQYKTRDNDFSILHRLPQMSDDWSTLSIPGTQLPKSKKPESFLDATLKAPFCLRSGVLIVEINTTGASVETKKDNVLLVHESKDEYKQYRHAILQATQDDLYCRKSIVDRHPYLSARHIQFFG